jgi:surfactin synthase thioesterase subunit
MNSSSASSASTLPSNAWLVRPPPSQRRLRLYCFSFAGGSASTYLPWQAELGPDIEVCPIQLPGRGMRLLEEPYTSFRQLVTMIGQILANECQQDRRPFAFFGHSLGAVVAFEVARFCSMHALPMPERLIVSGCDAPQHPSPSKNLHLLSDDELIEALKEYNGSPPEVLAHRELMKLLLPCLRADFCLSESYEYRSTPPLAIPITVFAGKQDPHISPSDVIEWRKETTAPCRLQWFEGDHFFINPEQDLVLQCIAAELADPQMSYPERALAILPPSPPQEAMSSPDCEQEEPMVATETDCAV